MNIYLDAQPLLGAHSGVWNYIRHLSNNLMEIEDIDLFLFFNNLFKNNSNGFPASGKSVNCRYPYKVLRKFFKPNLFYNLPFDKFVSNESTLFHGTNFTHIPTKNNKIVITIHDLAFMIYPETTSERIYKHHTRWVPFSAQKADKVIAISEHTKKDIVNLLGIPPTKIEVVPLAASTHYKPLDQKEIDAVIQKYSLPNEYILFVGTLEPRKNLIGLLTSFKLFKQNSSSKAKLVVVGANGWKFHPIFKWVEQHNLENEVIFMGFIEDDDLAAIYNGAALFVMPSVYEGFGIPILEAMQCGISVIASKVSAIPEIVDGYGILISPNDYEQWAIQMDNLLTNQALNEKYKQLSLTRAQEYSWKSTALQTKMVYDKVLNS